MHDAPPRASLASARRASTPANARANGAKPPTRESEHARGCPTDRIGANQGTLQPVYVYTLNIRRSIYEEGFQRNQLNNLAIYNFDFAGDSANSSR